MATVPTVTIRVPTCKGNASGELLIDASDYDPARHQLAGGPAPEPSASAPQADAPRDTTGAETGDDAASPKTGKTKRSR